ncbi:MAG: 50S ribosomal protein L1 [Candidatus Nanoarchaeia archaeon]|nr:50S ribosomal protein L1 [Candidatus Nanoarchaeia archaeon]
MDKKEIINAVKKARETAKKRSFTQSFDISVNYKEIDLKKIEPIEVVLDMPKGLDRKPKICAFVDKSMIVKAKDAFDLAILKDDFSKYNTPKQIRKLAGEYDIFVAQGNIMVDVAKYFGKFLAPRNKMPNPKLGHIFPADIDLKPIAEKIARKQYVKIKKAPVTHLLVGTEKMSDEDIAENINYSIDSIISHLPGGKANIKSVYVKLTMGPVVRLM